MRYSVDLGPDESDKVNRLGGASWIEYAVRQDILPGLYEEALPDGYEIEYDDTLAATYVPVVAEYQARDPAELETIYYRIVKRPNAESCIQYLYYWNFQVFPPHSYDYEPIYVYFRDGRLDHVAFDFFHYDALIVSFATAFQICGLWHAFGAIEQTPKAHLDRPIMRLDNAILCKWYNRPHPESRLVIRQKLTDPWLVRSTFRDDDKDLMFPYARPALQNIDEYYQKTLAPKKTFSTVEALRANQAEMNRRIMEQFLAAGYVQIQKGHAVWTTEGEEIRNALMKNANER